MKPTAVRIYNYLAWSYRKHESRFIDWLWNINTGEKRSDAIPGYSDGHACETLYYWHLKKIFKYLPAREDDVFVDLGCGYGRVLFYAATRGFKHVEGYEIRKELSDQIKINIDKFETESFIEVELCDARKVNLYRVTVIYMFNPFGIDTLRQLMNRIMALNNSIRIAYVYNESIDCRDYMDGLPWTGIEQVPGLPCKIYSFVPKPLYFTEGI